MGTLLYSAAMSLDGFIAGVGGDMSWLTRHLGGPNPTADRLLNVALERLPGETEHWYRVVQP